MKKAISTLVAVGVIAAVLPGTAAADTLPGSYARDKALDVALDWSLSSPEAAVPFVDYCKRRSAHKFACDANISWTTYGELYCPSYSSRCHETDTDHLCWKTVTATLSPHWQRWKVRYRLSRSTCRSHSYTEYF